MAALLRDPAVGGVAISIPPTSPRHAALYINGWSASKASPKPLALASPATLAAVALIPYHRAQQQRCAVALVGPDTAGDGEGHWLRDRNAA